MISDEQLRAMRDTRPVTESGGRPATEAQEKYITGLLADKAVPDGWAERIQKYRDTGQLTVPKASQIIKELLKLPKGQDKSIRIGYHPSKDELPEGRYALPLVDGTNDIAFYRVWRDRMETKVVLYRIIGPDSKIVHYETAAPIMKRIIEYGVLKSASLYGESIGACSVCHRRLTNRLSRRLGIGPVCGGRLGEGWEALVTERRREIEAEGLDPDEEVN